MISLIDSFEKAQSKAKKAEETSDLNTEDETKCTKRRRIIRNQYSSTSEDEEEVYVKRAPTLKKTGKYLSLGEY